jgi:hypothetical protein
MQIYRRWGVPIGTFIAGVLLASAVYVWQGSDVQPEALPEHFSDAEYWRLINEFSEPGGYFRSDNFISNETTFQYVIPELKKKLNPAGSTSAWDRTKTSPISPRCVQSSQS